jgi:predicted enzyme related to lactoylglutathione lyase
VPDTLQFGSFCTSVLRTTDPQRAAKFYMSLLGWTAQSAAVDHTFLQNQGKTVASIHQTPAFPQAWIPHVLVEDVEATAQTVTALGGTVLDATRVPGVARLAIVQDREAAVFGLWQPDPHRGAEEMEGLGSIWWIELLSHDVDAARDFYGRLFGWTSRDTSFEPIDIYTVFERPGWQEAGVSRIRPEWNLSPMWITFVSVPDCDATLARACDLGGSSLHVHTVPKNGRIGAIADPHRVWLSIRGPVPAQAGL